MFDIDALDTKALSQEGVTMPVRGFDGTPIVNRKGEAITLTLKGPDSTEYRASTRAQVRKRMARSGVPDEATVADDEADTLDILAACTIAWSGVMTKDSDDPVPFSTASVRQLYLEFPAIRDQVDVFMASRVNFTRASARSSSNSESSSSPPAST